MLDYLCANSILLNPTASEIFYFKHSSPVCPLFFFLFFGKNEKVHDFACHPCARSHANLLWTVATFSICTAEASIIIEVFTEISNAGCTFIRRSVVIPTDQYRDKQFEEVISDVLRWYRQEN